jgi:hypothetical protein
MAKLPQRHHPCPDAACRQSGLAGGPRQQTEPLVSQGRARPAVAIGAPFCLPYGSGALGRGDFKIRGLKPLPPPSFKLLCVSSETNLETNGSHGGTCVSGPIQARCQLQRVPYEVRRVQRVPYECMSFADRLSVSKLTRPLPLFLQKRRERVHRGRSASCHFRTDAPQQKSRYLCSSAA